MISPPLSDRWSLTIRCVRLTIAGLVAAAIAFPGCASASSAVFDDFNGPRIGPKPRLVELRYRPWVGQGASKPIAPPTLSLTGKAISPSAPSKPAAASNQVAFRHKNKLSLGYGKITARIKMPSGQGLWPAFWLVGADEATTPWPGCGEIDVIELVSGTTTYFTTIHGPRSGSSQPYQVQFSGAIPDLSTDYHEYWVEHVPMASPWALTERH